MSRQEVGLMRLSRAPLLQHRTAWASLLCSVVQYSVVGSAGAAGAAVGCSGGLQCSLTVLRGAWAGYPLVRHARLLRGLSHGPPATNLPTPFSPRQVTASSPRKDAILQQKFMLQLKSQVTAAIYPSPALLVPLADHRLAGLKRCAARPAAQGRTASPAP